MMTLLNTIPKSFQERKLGFLAILASFFGIYKATTGTTITVFPVTITFFVTEGFEGLKDFASKADLHGRDSRIKGVWDASRYVTSGRELMRLPRLQTVCHSQEYSTK